MGLVGIKLDQKFTHDFEVSREVYEGFINIFKDRNELHTDENFAQAKGFKSIVMHGNILNGFVSYFVGECLPLRNVIIHSQEIKFSNPVFLEDNLKLEAKISDIYESVGVFEVSFKFKNESGSSVARGAVQVGTY
ncbi:MaoC family dehydratase [Gammaproteobacteria bacterium]|nr:MaoC family dehydratase [Gammaproteobacteria bacterium]